MLQDTWNFASCVWPAREELHQLLVVHVQELVQIHATIRELAEGTLLLDISILKKDNENILRGAKKQVDPSSGNPCQSRSSSATLGSGWWQSRVQGTGNTLETVSLAWNVIYRYNVRTKRKNSHFSLNVEMLRSLAWWNLGPIETPEARPGVLQSRLRRSGIVWARARGLGTGFTAWIIIKILRRRPWWMLFVLGINGKGSFS